MKTPHRPPTHSARGFTLPELLVALLLFGLGALALVSSSRFIVSLSDGARTQALAGDALRSLLDSLRSQPCTTLAGGSDSTRGIALDWNVSAAPGAQQVRTSVRFRDAHRRRTLDFESLLPCDR